MKAKRGEGNNRERSWLMMCSFDVKPSLSSLQSLPFLCVLVCVFVSSRSTDLATSLFLSRVKNDAGTNLKQWATLTVEDEMGPIRFLFRKDRSDVDMLKAMLFHPTDNSTVAHRHGSVDILTRES
jgi:hypothetical protein